MKSFPALFYSVLSFGVLMKRHLFESCNCNEVGKIEFADRVWYHNDNRIMITG